jgi:hypothetical protein
MRRRYMPIELEQIMYLKEFEGIGVSLMSEEQRQLLFEWGMRMYSLGKHIVSEIDSVKYEGRLIVLQDGTRWEVNSLDTMTAELWSPLDKVIIIDEEMFKLDSAEGAGVTKEE